MTPYEIDILLWYYTRTSDHPDTVRRPPIWPETLSAFVASNLLEASDDDAQRWQLTERGRAYCEALQLVPLPDAAWKITWPSTVNL